jgi:outer membrane protein assembly factor BamE (lipoprotein component of BamABCDE complex)
MEAHPMKHPKIKHIVAIIILLAFCFSACNSAGSESTTAPSETVNSTVAAQSEITNITDEVGDVYIGMTTEEFLKVVPESDHLGYCSHAFYTNEKGNHIVVRFSQNSGPSKILEIKCYDHNLIEPTPEKFDMIKKGMSIFDVVALVGIPFDSLTFGAVSFEFKDTNGKCYRIYMDIVSPERDCTLFVSSVLAL